MAPIAHPADPAETRPALAIRLLVLLATFALTLGLVGPVGGAVADEDDDEDVTEIEVEAEAYWTNSAAEALPPLLFSEFPPGAMCIVAPEFCAGTSDLQEGISDAIGEDVDLDAVRGELLEAARDQHSPVQPVQPETLPTGRLAGVARYVSALAFDLPPTPEGQEIVRFELVFTETQPTYAMDSPAFRQAVLATLVAVDNLPDFPDEDSDAEDLERFIEESQQMFEAFAGELAKIAEDPETHSLMEDSFTDEDYFLDIEACPTTEQWEAGDNQEWDDRPGTDCILGATGERDDDGNWRFDLTFAAQAWDDGMLANTGLYLGPLAAANLAFGDPDTSDNAQVSLAGGDNELGGPVAIIEYGEAFEPVAFEDSPSPADDAEVAPAPAETANGEVFGRTDPQMQADTTAEPAPQAAPAPETAPEQQPQVVAAQQADPTTPWYAWLTLVAGLAGLVALSQALAAEPALAAERSGAMTRLIEQRNGAGGGPDPLAKV